MKDKVKNVGGKIKSGAKKVKEKVRVVDDRDSVKPKIVSRLLFYTVYNFILLVFFFITVLITAYSVSRTIRFDGVGPGFKAIVCAAIFIFILYLILNWIYKCVVKSMLCVTDNEVYAEIYIPFYRYETSIPLNKITGITSVNFLWIFRTIIIHQYGKMPFVFPTWNNKEFKDQLSKLTTGETKKVDSQAGHEALIPKSWRKGVIISLIIILAIFVFAFFLRLLDKASYGSIVKHLDGTYKSDDVTIVLNDDYTCSLDGILHSSTYTMNECTWTAVEKVKSGSADVPEVVITYTYYHEYTSWYTEETSRYDYEEKLDLTYQNGDLVNSNGDVYEKQ